MFNKDALFGKKDEGARPDARGMNVNVTPDLNPGAVLRQPEAQRPERTYEQPRGPNQSEEPAGSKLIVGPDIKLKGVEITDCDTLVVEGRVEASMDSRVVQIAEHGVFTGTATMDVAEIWGSFQGQLTVRKHLVVYSTGRVSGQIRYGQIRIEDGGELSGEVSTLAASQPAPRRAEPAPERPAPAAPPAPAPAAAPGALRGSPSATASPSPVRPGATASR